MPPKKNVPHGGKPAHHSYQQRNLAAADLGGVVFGCTEDTYGECMTERVFCLPKAFFCFVQHVTPGMPVFLFNFTDRKLHGVFWAASAGGLDIKSTALTGNAGATRFPAQVLIKPDLKTVGLPEKLWRPVLEDNFINGNHFLFELDKIQARNLCALCHRQGGQPLAPGSRGLANRAPPASFPLQSASDVSPPHAGQTPSSNGRDSTFTAKPSPPNRAAVPLNEQMEYVQSSVDLALTRVPPDTREPLKTCFQAVLDVISSLMIQNMDLEKKVEEQARVLQEYSNQSGSPSTMDPCVEDASLSPDYAPSMPAPDKVQAAPAALQPQETPAVLPGIDAGLHKQQIPTSNTTVTAAHVPVAPAPTPASKEPMLIIIGGFDHTSYLPSVQGYKPEKGEVTSFSDMEVARWCAGAATIGNSIYVVGGGADSGYYSSVSRLDLLSGKVSNTASMSIDRASHAVVAMEGKLHVIGGQTQTPDSSGTQKAGMRMLDSCEIYHPDIDRWIHGPTLPVPLTAARGHAVDGCIYVLGGIDGKQSYKRTLFQLDPRMGKWMEGPEMKQKRAGHSCALFGNQLHCMGGMTGQKKVLSSHEMYSPRAGVWEELPPLPIPHVYGAGCGTNDGVYMTGGLGDLTSASYVGAITRYNPATRDYTTVPCDDSLHFKRAFHSMVAISL